MRVPGAGAPDGVLDGRARCLTVKKTLIAEARQFRLTRPLFRH